MAQINYKSDWNDVLKEKRRGLNFTQEEIAVKLNTYKSKWSTYESGKAFPSELEWNQIYFLLNASPFDFFEFKNLTIAQLSFFKSIFELIHLHRENKSETIDTYLAETTNEISALLKPFGE